MLQFIFGRASTGKSTYLYDQIAQNTACYGNMILLVPEQFTFESEKAMLSRMGSGYDSKVEVLSFTRLFENAGRLYGGIAGRRITEAERHILMRKAVCQNAPLLKVYQKQANSHDFVKRLNQTVTELKMAGISADELLKAAPQIKGDYLSAKVQDIALIYAAYDQLLSGVFLDPLDDLKRLYHQAKDHQFFKDKTIYIDAFKGFTGQQLNLLKLMIEQAANVYVALCLPEKSVDKFGLFSNVATMAERLKQFANQANVAVESPVILKENYFKNEELRALEKLLADCGKAYSAPAENITVATLKNRKQEVYYTYKTIHQLVRNENYRYRDFVIIARDISVYEQFLKTFGKRFGVPCYYDRRINLTVSPLVRFVLFALKAAENFESSAILSMLKTDMLGYSATQVSMLEEYVYIWDINKKDWKKPFNMSPYGMDDHKITEKDLQNLNQIEQMRNEIVAMLSGLNRSFGGTGKAICHEIYRLLINQKIDEKTKQLCESANEQGNFESADLLAASWEELMKVLDSLVVTVGKDDFKANDFCKIFETSVSAVSLGNIPSTLDEVSAGSADRIRPSRPKVAFLLGLNQGEFPRSGDTGGLLIKNDRAVLANFGFELNDRLSRFAVEENFILYTSVCCADEKVFLCNHQSNDAGEGCEPSAVIDRVQNSFKQCGVVTNLPQDLPETAEDAYGIFIEQQNQDPVVGESLKQVLNENNNFNKQLSFTGNFENPQNQTLSEAAIQNVLGKELSVSASKLETYDHCAFSFFCRYVLKIEKPQKVDFNSMQRGTIVHYVLENVLKNAGADFTNLSETALMGETKKTIESYFAAISGAEILKTPRLNFLVAEICKTIVVLLKHLQDEFKHSRFVPECFELSIGYDGEVPALVLTNEKGQTVSVTGKIDRLDALHDESGDFIRIVDYKTGAKSFYLCDLLNGLNMQMMLYLYIVKKQDPRYQNSRVAGILYMPSKRGVGDYIKKEKELKTSHQMNGMLNDDDVLLSKMDDEFSGRFIANKGEKSARGYGYQFMKEADFNTVFSYLDHKLRRVSDEIFKGNFNIDPLDGCESEACKYCQFSTVCRRSGERENRATEHLSVEQVTKKMQEELENE